MFAQQSGSLLSLANEKRPRLVTRGPVRRKKGYLKGVLNSMNSGVRLDWLSLSINGTIDFLSTFDYEGDPITGIRMYPVGRQFDYYKIYLQEQYNISYPVACLVFDHSLLWGCKYDMLFDILSGISSLPGFDSYHVQRADLSVLIDSNPIGKLETFINRVRGNVSRKVNNFGENGNPGTVYLGRGDKVLVRMYDKKAELMANEHKFYVLEEVGQWKEVYNVEYQLRRKWLKDYGIHSMGDLYASLQNGDLWKYLTNDYFRLESGRGIQTSWREVMEAVWKQGNYEEFIDVMVKEVDPDRLYASINGMLKRLARVERYSNIVNRIRSMTEGLKDYECENEEQKRFRVRKVADTVTSGIEKET